MSTSTWLLVGLGAFAALYAAGVLALIALGRRSDARALAGFIPDCLVLVRRLMGDARVARRRRWLLGGLVAYLALPFDLVPDFIPVAGQLDDALAVALVLRVVLRGASRALLEEHWPGPRQSLRVIGRLCGIDIGRRSAGAT